MLKRLLRDSLSYGVIGALPSAVGLLLLPVYTRYLTPADYGIVALSTLIAAGLAPLLVLGQDSALARAFHGKARGDADIGRTLYSVSVVLLIADAAVVSLVLLTGPTLLAWALPDSGLTFYPFVVIALSTALVAVPQTLMLSIARIRGDIRRFAIMQVGLFLVSTVATLALVVGAGAGAVGSLAGKLLGAASVLPLAVFWLSRESRGPLSWPRIKRSLAYGAPLVPHALAGWTLSVSDRFILGHYLPTAQVGIYSVAYTLGSSISLIAVAANTAWMPIYYDLAAQREPSTEAARGQGLFALLLSLVAAIVVLTVPSLLIALTPRAYWGAQPIVAVVVAAYWTQIMYFCGSAVLFYHSKTRWVAVSSGAGAVLNVLVNLALVPRFGMVAAAWSTFATLAIMAVLAIWFAQRAVPGSVRLRPMALSCIVFGAAWALETLVQTGSTPVVMAGVARGIGVVAALLGGVVTARRWTAARRAVSLPPSSD